MSYIADLERMFLLLLLCVHDTTGPAGDIALGRFLICLAVEKLHSPREPCRTSQVVTTLHDFSKNVWCTLTCSPIGSY